jgi:hypothetical protein
MNFNPRNSSIPALQGAGYLIDNALAGAALPVNAGLDVVSKGLNVGNWALGGDASFFPTNRTKKTLNFGRTGSYNDPLEIQRLAATSQPAGTQTKQPLVSGSVVDRDNSVMQGGLPKSPIQLGQKDLSQFSFGGIPQSDKPAPVQTQYPDAPTYNPMYENAAKQNYEAQSHAIQSALNPIKEHHESLINQLNDYSKTRGYMGKGGGIAAATALGMVQNDYDQQAGMAKEEARLMGGLAPNNIDAMKYGMESAEKAKLALFNDKLPSSQSRMAHEAAQIKKLEHDATTQKQSNVIGGITSEYLSSLKPEERLAMGKQLMTSKDNSHKEKMMADIATGLAEGKISPDSLSSSLRDLFKSKGIIGIQATTPKK